MPSCRCLLPSFGHLRAWDTTVPTSFPETDYCVGPGGLSFYLDRVNRLLTNKGHSPITQAQLTGQVNQLKAFIDVCRVYDLEVIPDVLYNHAGGSSDGQSLDYFGRPTAMRRTAHTSQQQRRPAVKSSDFRSPTSANS